MDEHNTSPDAAEPVVSVRGLWTAFGTGPSQVVIHKDLELTHGTPGKNPEAAGPAAWPTFRPTATSSV